MLLRLYRRGMTNTALIDTLPMSRVHTFALRVDAEGVDADRPMLAAIARRGRALGVSETLLDILTDPREPEVARERALGRVMARVGATDRAQAAAPQPQHRIDVVPRPGNPARVG